MPYKKKTELPDGVKKLPAQAQDIYMAAFNSAYEQYDGDEPKSHATAWSAVKRKYKQNADGEWTAKEATHPHGEHVCVCPECSTETTVAEGVKCNTQKCPECGTTMQAKEAGERKTKESLSMENKRQLLQTAVQAKFQVGDNWPYVEDVTDSNVIYSSQGQSYSAPYTIGDDGAVMLGDSKRVVRQTIYAPLESLRRVYSDIIHEAGKRNAASDSSRIKKIMELCQELLSSETPDEKTTQEALRTAQSDLEWLRAQEAYKTEDGEDYPASAFAYVPDSGKPSTWKLRLWESTTKQTTRQQLSKAAAALSPGGYKGQKPDIPDLALSDVRRRIRSAYRSLSVDDGDIPKWVKESVVREPVIEVYPLSEAKLNNKGIAQLVVIQPGFNTSKERYYPADMLGRDYAVFEGAKMFADHASISEEKDRPERSIKDWVATLKNVHVDESGRVVGDAVIIEPWMQEKLAQLRDKDLLSEMGVSINAVGTGTRSVIEGTKTSVIEKLTAVRSVDFVTWPGAGGMVTLYETADRDHDIDLISLEALKAHRPDLVRELESAAKAEIMQEVKRMNEQEEKIKTLEGQIETLTTERDDLKTKVEEADKAKAKAEAQAVIKEAVSKAELPDAAKAKLLERFKDSETDTGVAEAIESEKTYIAALAEAGKVKGLGPEKPINTEDSHAALVESFRKSGLSEEEAKIAASVR